MLVLYWISRSRVSLVAPSRMPWNVDAVALLEGLRQRDEVLGVHLERVGMAGDSPASCSPCLGDLAVHGRGPVTLGGLADHHDGTAIFPVPVLHGLERGDHLVVVVAVVDGEDVPAIGGPLVDQVVRFVLRVDHAAEQRIVDAGVVVGDHHAQALADFQRQGLRLEFLRVAFGHGELAFERDHLGRVDRGADHVPERGFPGGRGDADAGRSAVHVIGDVGGFRMAGQRLNAARFGLREQRMIRQSIVLEQSLHRARAAAESERIDRQNRDVRIGEIALVARRFELARQSLAHDHPQRVTGGDAVPAGEHELVAIGMLGTAIIVAQAAQLRPGQMDRHVVRRIRQRSAKVPGLGIIPQQHQRHAGHEPDVFQAFAVVGRGEPVES